MPADYFYLQFFLFVGLSYIALIKLRDWDITHITFLSVVLSLAISVLFFALGGFALALRSKAAVPLYIAGVAFDGMTIPRGDILVLSIETAIALFLAVISIWHIKGKLRSNNSFKPKPLRGSA